MSTISGIGTGMPPGLVRSAGASVSKPDARGNRPDGRRNRPLRRVGLPGTGRGRRTYSLVNRGADAITGGFAHQPLHLWPATLLIFSSLGSVGRRLRKTEHVLGGAAGRPAAGFQCEESAVMGAAVNSRPGDWWSRRGLWAGSGRWRWPSGWARPSRRCHWPPLTARRAGLDRILANRVLANRVLADGLISKPGRLGVARHTLGRRR